MRFIEERKSKMDEEILKEIEEIVNYHLKQFNARYLRIRDVYKNDYRLPELMSIKSQICKCIAFGLHVAAMTLTNHLLEKSIKIFLIYSDNLRNKNKEGHKPFEMIDEIEEATPKYDDKNLSSNLQRAVDNGVITEEERVLLDKMRNDYRNSYAHSDRKKMYKNGSIEITEVFGTEQCLDFIQGKEDKLPKRDVKLVNFPMMDFLFIKNHAEMNCIPYIITLDKIITDVKRRMMPNSEIKS